MKSLLRNNIIALYKAETLHAEPVFALINKNKLRLNPFFPWVIQIKSPQNQFEFYQAAHRLWEAKKEFHYVISFEEKIVGAISVHSINWTEGEVQFGYWVDSNYEGKGIISSAIQLLEKNLILKGVTRFVIRFHDNNHRSKKLALNLDYLLIQGPLEQSSIRTCIKYLT